MAVISSVLSELEAAIHGSDASKRVATLRRVTDYFLGQAGQLNDAQVELFDEVLMCLIHSIESKALAQLSMALAPIGNAPAQTLRRLANDNDISVAGPILSTSNQLPTSELVAIASNKGQDHMLALSERAALDIALTDILVSRGDHRVISRLVDNAGAAFSSFGFDSLANRVEGNQELTERLGRRLDIPPETFQRLLRKASDYVRERLLADAPEDRRDFLERAVAKASEDVDRNSVIGRQWERAAKEVRALELRGELTPMALGAFARGDRFPELSIGLAALLSVPQSLVSRVAESRRGDAWLVLFRAAGVDLSTVIIAVRMPSFPTNSSETDVETIRSEYLKLSASTAQRVLRFWKIRHVSGE